MNYNCLLCGEPKAKFVLCPDCIKQIHKKRIESLKTEIKRLEFELVLIDKEEKSL